MTKKELRKLIRKEVKQIIHSSLIEHLVKTTIREMQGAGIGMEPGISPSVNSMPARPAKTKKRDEDGVPIGEGMSFKDRIQLLANLPQTNNAAELLRETKSQFNSQFGSQDDDDDVDIDKLAREDLQRK